MAFTAPAPEGFEKREPIPVGLVAARCYALIDLGRQNDSYMGEPKIIHKIHLAFEIPKYRYHFKDKNGNEKEGPSVISEKYTFSMSEKANLRKLIKDWFSKDFPSNEAAAAFDLEKLIGKTCMINVVHSKCGKYANIGGIAPYMKEMGPPPAAELDPIVYTDGSAAALEKVPDWLKKIIAEQVKEEPLPQETKMKSDREQLDSPFDDDDIPF